MLPLRPAALFRSRWSALFYAAGILWFALEVAGTKPAPDADARHPAAASPADAPDLNVLAAEVRQFESIR